MLFKKKSLFLILLFSLIVPKSLTASPNRYTLEGSVRAVYGNKDAVNALGLQAGDSINYAFVVDEVLEGFTLYGDEVGCDSSSADENQEVVSYYAELESISYTIADTYYNFDSTNYLAADITPLYGDNQPYTVVVVGQERIYFHFEGFLKNYNIGDTITGVHWWHDSMSGEFMTMFTDLLLADIDVPVNYEALSLCGEKSIVVSDSTESNMGSNSGGGGGISPFLLLTLMLLSIFRKSKIS